MLNRLLEPEVMDTPEEARAYDQMDHAEVNRRFVDDLLAFLAAGNSQDGSTMGEVLDLGTGTALIPIQLCSLAPDARVLAVDAAASMIQVAHQNVSRAGLGDRIELRQVDAKHLPFADASWPVAMSNSIVHHIPDPLDVLAEAVRVAAPGGTLFFRDLLRPADEAMLTNLVDTYTAGATDEQRRLFADSLRAALALEEVRDLVAGLGFRPETVNQTSDRHWTWAATRAADS